MFADGNRGLDANGPAQGNHDLCFLELFFLPLHRRLKKKKKKNQPNSILKSCNCIDMNLRQS